MVADGRWRGPGRNQDNRFCRMKQHGMKGYRGQGDLFIPSWMRHDNQIYQLCLRLQQHLIPPPSAAKLAVASSALVSSPPPRPCSAVSLSNKLVHGRFLDLGWQQARNTARGAANRATMTAIEKVAAAAARWKGQQNLRFPLQLSPESTGRAGRSAGGDHQYRIMDNHRGPSRESGFIYVLEHSATEKQLQLDGAAHLARNTTQTGHQLGDGLIAKIEPVSDAYAQRVSGTPFDDGKVLTVPKSLILWGIGASA